jgi:hypothetical protein
MTIKARERGMAIQQATEAEVASMRRFLGQVETNKVRRAVAQYKTYAITLRALEAAYEAEARALVRAEEDYEVAYDWATLTYEERVEMLTYEPDAETRAALVMHDFPAADRERFLATLTDADRAALMTIYEAWQRT